MLHTAHLPYAEPLLRTRSSNMGGSGYRIPMTGETYPGVTTVSGILAKPGVEQWGADQVAIRAVTNIDALLNRSVSEGFAYLRFSARSELSRAAKIGTNMHDWLARSLAGLPLPAVEFEEVQQMIAAWHEFLWEHSFVPSHLEATVVNRDLQYAGTADGFGMLDGESVILDWKSAKSLWPENKAQLAALSACDELMVLDPEGEYEYVRSVPEGWLGETRVVRGEPKAVTRWSVETVPDHAKHVLVHIRPSGYDENDEPHDPFVKLHYLSDAEIEAGWMRFNGCLQVKRAEAVEKQLVKGEK